MSFWVYILRCNDGRYYTGHSDNLEARLAQHKTGGFCDYTSRRRPVEHVWSETFPTRIEALEAERRIKPWSRAKKEALIAGDWAALSFFAKPPHERSSALIYPERPPQAAVDGLGTNGNGVTQAKPGLPKMRPSTSLGTNGGFGSKSEPFVSSEVETRSPPRPTR